MATQKEILPQLKLLFELPYLKKKVLKKGENCTGEISRSNLTHGERFNFTVPCVAEYYFYFASLNIVSIGTHCDGYSFGVLFSFELSLLISSVSLKEGIWIIKFCACWSRSLSCKEDFHSPKIL